MPALPGYVIFYWLNILWNILLHCTLKLEFIKYSKYQNLFIYEEMALKSIANVTLWKAKAVVTAWLKITCVLYYVETEESPKARRPWWLKHQYTDFSLINYLYKMLANSAYLLLHSRSCSRLVGTWSLLVWISNRNSPFQWWNTTTSIPEYSKKRWFFLCFLFR